jgi:crotonobetainyl-CoA:carnitine CoA-transferase CaiB-like acyl-CoA transferase
MPELKTDPRFAKRDNRKKNRKELTILLEAGLKQQPTDYWVDALNSRGVPSGEILGLEDALKASQVRHRKTIREVHAEGIGELQLFNVTAQFGKTPASVECPPPRLGSHTAELLEELGYTEQEVREFKEKGTV